MALHSRKVPLARTDDVNPQTSEKNPSHCYMCYICPGDCYTQPPPPPPLYTPSGSHYMSTLFILMLCTLGIIFLFLSYLTIGRFRASLRNSRRRNPGEFREDFLDENQGPVIDHPIWYVRTVGLPQSIIDSISGFKYKRDEKMMEGRDCSVCLNEFQEDESLRLLPKCSHAFHQPCIDTWLRSHQNCPVCRAPIMIGNVTNVAGNLLDTGRANLGSREENQNRAQSEEMETDETREMRGEPGSSTTMPLQEDLLFKIGCNLNTGNGSLRVLSDLTDGRAKVDQELQRLRRSVSMDSSSALMIYPAVANGCTKADEGCSDARQETLENQNSEMTGRRGCKNSRRKSSSSGRFLQKGPILMKRSFSFSGKRSLRKNNSRSPESVSIPGISTQNRGR